MFCACAVGISQCGSISYSAQSVMVYNCAKFHACIAQSGQNLALSRLASTALFETLQNDILQIRACQ